MPTVSTSDSYNECDSGSNSDDAEEALVNLPLEKLPALPDRNGAYWSEPCMGICIVGTLSFMLVSVTQGLATVSEAVDQSSQGSMDKLRDLTVFLIWAEAVIAVLCTLFLLFGQAGVIHRSPKNCYPVPSEILLRLDAHRSLDGLKNVRGEDGRSYCVRCCLWRPSRQEGRVHHCQVCQRCVRGFDHHCGVFGRCIVRENMPCFITLIGMMFAGMATAMVAVTAGSYTEEVRL